MSRPSVATASELSGVWALGRTSLDGGVALLRRLGGARHYGLTFLTEFAGLASGLIVLRLAAVYWGTAGFGEYMLARRLTGMIQLPVLLGMGLALTRFMARQQRISRERADEYFLAGTTIAIATTVVVVVVMNLFASPLAALALGDPTLGHLIRAMSVAVAGLVLHAVAYSVQRGRLEMGRANALQAWNLAIVPLALFAVPRLSASRFILLLGVVWIVSAGVVLLTMLHRTLARPVSVPSLRSTFRPMLSYGVSRIPGEFAFGALFALPVSLAAHRLGLEGAGFVALAVSLLSMAGSLFAPLGQILLPAVSSLDASSDARALPRDVMRLVSLCVLLAAGPALLLVLLARPLLGLTLGEAFTGATPVVRLAAVAALPYVVYVVLRNVLDALDVRPLNSRNLLIALGVFAVGGAFARSATGIMTTLVISTVVLGLLTLVSARRVFKREIRAT